MRSLAKKTEMESLFGNALVDVLEGLGFPRSGLKGAVFSRPGKPRGYEFFNIVATADAFDPEIGVQFEAKFILSATQKAKGSVTPIPMVTLCGRDGLDEFRAVATEVGARIFDSLASESELREHLWVRQVLRIDHSGQYGPTTPPMFCKFDVDVARWTELFIKWLPVCVDEFERRMRA